MGHAGGEGGLARVAEGLRHAVVATSLLFLSVLGK